MHNSYSNTPSPQISALNEYYFPLTTSGDKLDGVPTIVLTFSAVELKTLAMPKSPSFTSPEDVRKTFPSFKSRCNILLQTTQENII